MNKYINHPSGDGSILARSESGHTSWIRVGQRLPPGWRYVSSNEPPTPKDASLEDKLEGAAETLGLSLTLAPSDDDVTDEWGRRVRGPR